MGDFKSTYKILRQYDDNNCVDEKREIVLSSLEFPNKPTNYSEQDKTNNDPKSYIN